MTTPDEHPMLHGNCPQCGGNDTVKSGADIPGKEGLQGSNRLPLSATMSAPLDNYVCTQCGYVETYIHDRTILTRIANTWQRIPPHDNE